MFSTRLGVVLALAIAVAMPAAATSTVDIVADDVTFEQIGSTWYVWADYTIQASSATSGWTVSWTVKQYRGGTLIATPGNGSISPGLVDVGTCTIFCNGTCFIGGSKGDCWGRTVCECDRKKTVGGVISSPQTGDVFKLEVTTSETEHSTTNNAAEATF